MRQLLPDAADVGDLIEHESSLERPPPPDRPWVLCNMIASADGAVAVGGRSGPLGGPADRALFRSLRSLADVILVGAATVRAERYQAPSVSEEAQAVRRGRGQAPHPRLAVVTSSGDLDAGLGLFDDPEHRPYVVTAASSPAAQPGPLRQRSELLTAGTDRVDLSDALRQLRSAGAAIVLVEGGPSLNAQLLAADVVDEWRLTVSPMLVAGSSARAATGPGREPPARFLLDRVLAADDLVFVRFLRP